MPRKSTPSSLRAVAEGEKAPRRKAQTVTEAVSDGDLRAQWVAMRARIAKAIDDPNIRGADLAALSRRLHELSRDIEALDARAAEEAGKGDVIGDGAFDASAI